MSKNTGSKKQSSRPAGGICRATSQQMPKTVPTTHEMVNTKARKSKVMLAESCCCEQRQ